ncbi:MAG: hypothetical protein IT215_00270 [Chitinophagaceae bacterium]|nr:MAG: hypothetical protein UZ11_BCD004000655 [Bacteroidetes bacterium OLB11]MCC6447107.1 hypothetical protein [Chitinophagaceae bacterium]HMN32049.1 hypothetical protein [Chitinophagaceae bacterium]
MNKNSLQILIVLIVIVLTTLMRIFNTQFHIYHLVPIAALGIFSGSILSNKPIAYAIPLLAMLLSDIGIGLLTNTPGFYGISQFVNYGALALITFTGTFLTNRKVLNIAGFSIGGSLLFFVLSNFGAFLSELYPMNLQGFIECYAMAIPFYKSELASTFFFNSFLGDLLFSFAAFGIYQGVKSYFTSLKTA